jgi:hypothetical protein
VDDARRNLMGDVTDDIVEVKVEVEIMANDRLDIRFLNVDPNDVYDLVHSLGENPQKFVDIIAAGFKEKADAVRERRRKEQETLFGPEEGTP